jgi:superfamily II DNA or RNA helicase
MANIVIQTNKYSQIQNENDHQFLKKLDGHLSFKVAGAEYTQAFNGYYNKKGEFIRWNGIQKLLQRNLIFSNGLLERVKAFYVLNNKEFTLIDKRSPKSINSPINIFDNLVNINKVPFPYQEETAVKVINYDRGIIRIATGGGKTLISALITAKLGKKTVIHVVGKSLMYQFYNLFTQVFSQPIGIVGDGHCDIQDITISSVWTSAKALGMKNNILSDDEEDEESIDENKNELIVKMLKEAKVHIVDEMHYSTCDSLQGIYKAINPEHIYGMSGTPWTNNNSDLVLESMFGQKIVDIDASFLIERDYLVKPIIKFVNVPKLNFKVQKHYLTIYSKYIVENVTRNNLIVENTKKLVSKGYKPLVIFSILKHGRILHEMLSEELRCDVLSGDDDNDTRLNVINRLEKGEIDCILASRIFEVGVDAPCISALVLASGGKSSSKALQRIGRVIRTYPNKKRAAVIDFNDDADYLKNHSKARFDTYCMEDGFDVS